MATHDYPLFSHWQQTLGWILDTTERLPQKVRFTLANRISELALDILEGIIEAIYQKQRTAILRKINLNLEKLRVLFSDDKPQLQQQVQQVDEYVDQRLQLTLKRKACWLNQSSQGLSFLGVRIFPSFLRHCTANRQRSLKKIKNRLQAYQQGYIDEQQMADSIQCSWAHLHYFD